MTSVQNWEKVAEAKRAKLAESIPQEHRVPQQHLPPDSQLDVTTWPKESGWFSSEELEITGSTATELLQKIASKTWSSEKVTRAFCKRAAAAQQLLIRMKLNCLTDAFFDEAIESAKALDEHLNRTGQLKGPFHGLPISLKDNFNIKGKDSSVGFSSLVNDPAEYNATLVDVLENLGAVRYCKTNVPTAMMIPESVNNVFGRTISPLNRKVTSGGSSGGESALIAFGGSPIGIGLAGQEAVASVNGPMARTLEDIITYSKAVINSQQWLLDPKVLPIPWRQVEQQKKLKIAVLWNDGICMPTPPVTRALKETVESLKKSGHEVVEWDPKLHAKALDQLGRMFVADGGKTVKNLLAPTGEPIRPEMQQYQDAQDLGVFEMWQLHLERTELQRQYLEQWMSYENLDAILGHHFKYVGYTGVFNVVDYSAVSFPTGITVDKTKDTSFADAKVQSEYCQAARDSCECSIATWCIVTPANIS
ncbi:hypothetical protein SNOG_14176 [Parastagonospora nodorum SN15]|uniref:Amidase domain-containing protein n=1 Tax=Phaeosphaeria nodorum (strain SN15 / ATCC MYA-4574 / FGSC 10173) TaxID=321614 RepID=Q0U215_PHANO|nr:hypothetical protein SNOG_14176 [Parastagonospora nodorum SN15]EAT78413.2 hypothetical protein SNOG_14176 [Parastagonospora nodorum SN15]